MTKGQKKTKYTVQQKQMAVAHAASFGTAKAAEKYNVPIGTLSTWVVNHKTGGHVSKRGTPAGDEHRQARGRLKTGPHHDAVVYLRHSKRHMHEALKSGRIKELDAAHLFSLLALQQLEASL